MQVDAEHGKPQGDELPVEEDDDQGHAKGSQGTDHQGKGKRFRRPLTRRVPRLYYIRPTMNEIFKP